MAETIENQIIQEVEQAARLYHRLVLVVAPSGCGKSIALRQVHDLIGAPIININLELSRLMLDLTERQRALRVPQLLDQTVAQDRGDVVLLDNTEILFDVSLKQDPLRLLQGISRNRTIAAAWNGTVANGHLVYAAPGHPEHRKYPVQGLIVVAPEESK